MTCEIKLPGCDKLATNVIFTHRNRYASCYHCFNTVKCEQEKSKDKNGNL